MITREASMKQGRNSRSGTDYVSTEWGDIRVRREGDGEKVVIFMPDAPAIIEHHDGVFSHRPEHMEFLSIEPIGTGFTLPDDRFNFSFKQFSNSLLSVIELSTSGPVTLAAGCCNGYFALMMAAIAPEKFEQLLIWQTPSWDQYKLWLDKWIDPDKQLRTAEGQAHYDKVKYAATKWWFEASGGPTADCKQMTETAHEAYDHGGCHCLGHLVQSCMTDRDPVFEKINTPTTILWCESDATHAQSTPESFLPYLTDGRIVRWKDAGHMPDLEFPDRLINLIQTL